VRGTGHQMLVNFTSVDKNIAQKESFPLIRRIVHEKEKTFCLSDNYWLTSICSIIVLLN
jgi:hypothetical protein